MMAEYSVLKDLSTCISNVMSSDTKLSDWIKLHDSIVISLRCS